MERLYKKYVNETVDEKGRLTAITFNRPDDFNFAYDVVDVLAKRSPDKRAMMWVSPDGLEKDITFKDVAENSAKVANYLVKKGIKKGDKVMLVLKRRYEFWYCCIALHKIGAVLIPATHQLMKKDFLYRFLAAGVKGLICTVDDNVHHEAEKAMNEYDGIKVRMTIKKKVEGWDFYDEEVEKESTYFPRPQGDADTRTDDIMLMFFTSGTTGYPKIAAHTFEYPLGHITTAVWWHDVNPDGLHFTIADTGWGKAMWGKLYGQWLAESAVFTYDYDRFNAHDMLSLFEKYGITTFCAPPTIYRMLIKEDISSYNLSYLKHATIAGEALNPEVFKQFYNATGLKLMEGFGQTESTLLIGNLLGTEPKPGSMGKPVPQYEIDLVDENGNTVPAGAEGEIVIRTDKKKPIGLFMEYYGSEETTKRAWHDGLYHTGDTAWRDEDGYFWYVARNDDIIKSSGYRIGPFEIESVLMEHKAVLECAVTGVPDPIRGMAVKATIVLTKGTTPSEELKKEIQEFVKTNTAPYKYPRIIEFVTELPKTISGKIRRTEIRGENK